MPNLNSGSKTYRNLKDAFGIESEESCRYLYFARQADIEGYPDVGDSSGTGPRPRWITPTVAWTTSRPWAIRPPRVPPPRVPSGAPQRTWGPRSPRRPTRTPRCIRAWLASHATGSPSCERAIEGGRSWVRSLFVDSHAWIQVATPPPARQSGGEGRRHAGALTLAFGDGRVSIARPAGESLSWTACFGRILRTHNLGLRAGNPNDLGHDGFWRRTAASQDEMRRPAF